MDIAGLPSHPNTVEECVDIYPPNRACDPHRAIMALKMLRLLLAVATVFCIYAVGNLLYALLLLLKNPHRALTKKARDSMLLFRKPAHFM